MRLLRVTAAQICVCWEGAPCIDAEQPQRCRDAVASRSKVVTDCDVGHLRTAGLASGLMVFDRIQESALGCAPARKTNAETSACPHCQCALLAVLSRALCRKLSGAAVDVFREQAEQPRSFLRIPDKGQPGTFALLLWQDPREPHAVLHTTYDRAVCKAIDRVAGQLAESRNFSLAHCKCCSLYVRAVRSTFQTVLTLLD